MPLDKEKIKEYLKSDASLYVYDVIDSTNDEAKRSAVHDGTIQIYAASCQTAGRGRRGHSFYSPKDTGLYMTLALPLAPASADIQKVTCAAAVAVCEAIEELSGKKAMIKWVNDIFIDNRKAAGILTEIIGDDSNHPSSVIIGIGLNLNNESFPDDIASIAGNIGDIERESLCALISDKLIMYYNDLSDNSIIEKYTKRSFCIGREVSFIRDGKRITAAAVGIDCGGGLIVDISGERVTLNSGEISVLQSI